MVYMCVCVCVSAGDKCQLKVVRAYMGSLMTSLEMAGVSLTLMKMESQWAQCLGQKVWMLFPICLLSSLPLEHVCACLCVCSDLATTAPGWPTASLGPDGSASRLDSTPVSCPHDDLPVAQNTAGIQTELGQVVFALECACLEKEFFSFPSLACLPFVIRKEDEGVCGEGVQCPGCC